MHLVVTPAAFEAAAAHQPPAALAVALVGEPRAGVHVARRVGALALALAQPAGDCALVPPATRQQHLVRVKVGVRVMVRFRVRVSG